MSRAALDPDPAPVTAPAPRAGFEDKPVMIDVEGVSKRFRIPDKRMDSFKERLTNPFTRVEHRELEALRDVSFDVRQGEFFGICGRNGSGKSTMLKILASIYAADAGRVRTAGRMAPFIELGVGFNPELTARENVALNGVLMGLGLREARRRLDAVLEFAELRDFVDLKLKNYSSGMLVRLAFALMVQADADIMLIDEVLAVGDAAFQQKCMDVFQERRRAGKTIVLVTHDMGTVQSLCHRAMLIHDGRLRQIGDPEETAVLYHRLNFEGNPTAPAEVHESQAEGTRMDFHARLLHAHVLDERGAEVENLEQREPIRLDLLLEAQHHLPEPILVLNVMHEDGTAVAQLTRQVGAPLEPGQKVRLAGTLENPFVPGRYFLDLWVRQDGIAGGMSVQAMRVRSFLVYGAAPKHGLVALQADLEPRIEP
jgi:ABC-2 type transport system ATP-binding protein